MAVELFPSFIFTTLLAQLSRETLYLDEKVVWHLVGLSLDGQSPRDLALQDPRALGRTTAFVRLPLPFRGPASITGSRFINFQLCQAHFTSLFSSVFEGKHVNRVGCFSCYKCGSRGAEGSSPTGRLVVHRRARPPPVSFLRLRAPCFLQGLCSCCPLCPEHHSGPR